MKKSPIKSLVKSIVRTFWKYLFKPVFIKPLPKSAIKNQLLFTSYVIEQREWWPRSTQISCIESIETHQVDDYLLSELQVLGQIEFNLQPSKNFLTQLHFNQYKPCLSLQANSLGTSYQLVAQSLKSFSYDVVFVAPWLKRGGADLGLLHHINACHQKGYSILLITTEDADSPWQNKLPQQVAVLEFGQLTKKLAAPQHAELLARILLQTSAQTIHNINSKLGWDVFKVYGVQLNAMGKNLFASVFCEDEVEPHVFYGCSPKYLSETFQSLTKVFCDTKWYPTIQRNLTGLESLFATIYFPFLGVLNKFRGTSNDAPILWASRIAQQKRPELLYKIAAAMPDQTFHVYGEVDKSCQNHLSKLQELSNIHYFGKYDNFSQIVAQQNYKIFLYTSAYDGLPNVLIEAISHGLPVVAYNVGGISELIHEKVLLADSNTLEENLTILNGVLNDETVLKQCWGYSRDILENRHSWNMFISTLENILGYFPFFSEQQYMAKNYQHIRVLSQKINKT